jgi:inner membrane protein
MLRKTHIAIGISSALAITHPTTVSGVVTALIGGSLGGWIVDIDCKNTDVDREDVYDAIIDVLFISAFIVLDYFVGNGMCQYISKNLGIKLLAVAICFIGLMIIGFKTTHRSFTHSLLGWFLYGMIMFILCRPIAIPFMSGYLSHIIVDLFNKKGEQLFFPLKTRFCFRLCDSDGKENKTLFWIAFILDVILGAFFLSQAMISAWDSSAFINKVLATKLLGLNALQIYLIFINIITFLGFQRSWKLKDREQLSEIDKAVKVQLEFETWLLDIFVFLGGGVGMLFSLAIHLAYPSAYNGNWWCFCYSSILLWSTVYCYVCNPFGYKLSSINWLSLQHIPLLMYVIVINVISALLTYSFRKKHLNEYRVEHTLLFLIGAFGGTIGGFISTIVVHRDRSFNYEVIGFPIMLISQIIFTMYMMSAGVI